MSVLRTVAIARKEFRHILRDLRTFFLVTVSPAFLLLTLSYIFAFDVEQVMLAMWDLDDSALSRRYVAELTAGEDFQIAAHFASYAELDRLLMSRRVDGGMIIPRGFEDGLRAGRRVEVQAVLDGTDAIAARQAAFDLEQRTAAFAAEVVASSNRVQPGGLDLRTESRYNRALKSLVSMVPGLMAVVLSMPALALALALTREKETGSFEGLIATPIRGTEYLVGKLAAYVVSGLGSVLLAWLVALLYFQVPFRGALSLYMVLAADYLLASMGFSLLIANFVDSQQTAMFLVLMVFFVPSFFIAGLITPVDTRNLASQVISFALPTTHFIAISRGIFLKGLSLKLLTAPALNLLGMGVGGLLISILFFRKRMA
ncbi:MAG: ABC transporter permease [Anaerolineae bacterium]|jgi:ABC-2 type transport system permease protein